MVRPPPLVVVALACASAGAGCTHAAPARPDAALPAQVVLSPDGAPEVRVTVELARSPSEQARGLMFRQHLAPGFGMLFINDAPRPLTFWMHNTYIPLDMIFIGGDLRVVGVVENAEPLTDTPRSVPGASQYVLEVPGGWAAEHHIGPGTRCQFLHVD